MITIHQPEIVRVNGRSRLNAVIIIDNEKKDLWYEVDSEYEKYLCYERSDAFLIAVLQYAMRKQHDIICTAPVTQELLYNVTQHLFPIFCNMDEKWHRPNITATTTSELLENEGAVGTAISCGIDSFHAILNHIDTANDFHPRLTHLVISDIGNYHDYKADDRPQVKENIVVRAKNSAIELKLPIIVSDSNITDAIPGWKQYSYKTAFTIHAMAKLWGVYLFASSYDYSHFHLSNPETTDPLYYDLLAVQCFSVRSLRIYSEAGAFTRIQKTDFISDNPVAHKFLYVCWSKGNNYGVCSKCRRSMLSLYILGKLDHFREVFPVEDFYKNIDSYWDYLGEFVVNKGDLFATEIYNYILRHNGIHAEKAKSVIAKFRAQGRGVKKEQSNQAQSDRLRIQALTSEVESLRNSSSWKITKPLREMSKVLKKIIKK